MKKFIVFMLAWVLSGNLFAAAIEEMVFFGDSLTDNGNLYNILKVIPRSPPYYKGRFTNGPTWAEAVGDNYADKVGIPYTIYAYGGATALDHQSGNQFYVPITLQSEIYEFYLHNLASNKSNKLYVIWIGANDYLMDDDTDADTLTSQVVDRISEGLISLMSQGARYFLILNLPDLGTTPFSETNKNKTRLHSLTEMHNEKLAKAIESFTNYSSDIKVLSLDAYGIFNDLLMNTQKYNQKYNANLTVLNEACWQGGLLSSYNLSYRMPSQILSSPGLKEAYLKGQMAEIGLDPCNHPEQYVFWDSIHPTVVVHQMLSAIAIDYLDKEAKNLLS